MVTTVLGINEIIPDPSIRVSRPVIAGAGATVINVLLAHTAGGRQSLESIAESCELTPGQVHTAVFRDDLHQSEGSAQIAHDGEESGKVLDALKEQGMAKPIPIGPSATRFVFSSSTNTRTEFCLS